MEEETIIITLKQYNDLLHDKEVLDALYAGGVDNWEWYDEAMSALEEGS